MWSSSSSCGSATTRPEPEPPHLGPPGPHRPARRLIVSADDFGLSEGVNEAVERAHREGVLSTASLMVAGPAAADAVRRARRLPGLRVGLHLVVIEGPAVLPPAELPALVDGAGWFPSGGVRLGVAYRFGRAARRQVAAEIAAQFRAFAATGLALDHANAHKHMHLHPTVGQLLLETGRAHKLRAIRVPSEPPGVLAACGTHVGVGARALRAWTGVLRAQCRRAGVRTNDHVFGLAWSGHMVAGRIRALIPRLPPGLSEVYFHPAAERDALLTRLMPSYEHEAELAALLDPSLTAAMDAAGVVPATWDG